LVKVTGAGLGVWQMEYVAVARMIAIVERVRPIECCSSESADGCA